MLSLSSVSLLHWHTSRRALHSVVKYEVALKTDELLLLVHGTPEALEKAKTIMAGTTHSSYAVHGEAVIA
jgi:hypothetical protein